LSWYHSGISSYARRRGRLCFSSAKVGDEGGVGCESGEDGGDWDGWEVEACGISVEAVILAGKITGGGMGISDMKAISKLVFVAGNNFERGNI
jgi:hypothetical protein